MRRRVLFFIEDETRLQVEHTITDGAPASNLGQRQFGIAFGAGGAFVTRDG